MNYFPFHVGDYLSATRHLNWAEDMAYRRLLDTYYTTEKPLPVDLRACCRLVIATTDEQREAVKIVLEEFFELSECGWRHARCDEEISKMQAMQAAQNTKAAHEAERMRRHRERRAELFEKLRSVGVFPAWDVSSKELQRLLDDNINAPETRTGALPETDPQRRSLPTPTPTPIPITVLKRNNAPRFDARAFLISKGVTEQQADDWLILRKQKRLPSTETAMDGIADEAEKAGVGFSEAIRECCIRGWGGFKSEWLLRDRQEASTTKARRASPHNIPSAGSAEYGVSTPLPPGTDLNDLSGVD